MAFKVGDRVVYPHHGAAVIERKEMREAFGEKTEYLVLRVANGDLTLAVPSNKAEDVGMRPPISVEDIDDLFQLLSKKDVREPTNWSRRFKNHQEKLKSGDVYQVAEVVRNLAARNRDANLSAAERTMYERARINLVSEIAPALGVSAEDAERYLDDALAKGVLREPAGAVKKKA
jgi:CarD family transcriptional regulator, regulator of rRNA transcription